MAPAEERKDIYKKSLKHFDDMRIAAYALDLIRGFIIEVGKFAIAKEKTEKRQKLELGALISTTVVLFIVVMSLLFKQAYDDYKKQKECEGSTCCYSCANFLMVLAIMSYFIGDNLTDLYDTGTDKDFRITSQILLITGLAGFKLLPQFKENMYKCFKEEDENALDDGIKENDKEEDKKSIKETNVVQSYTKRSVALLPEIDAWYTAFLNLFSTCSGAAIGATWTAYGLALIGVAVFLIVKICGDIRSIKKCCNRAMIITFGVIMLIATGLFLVSDNEMLLDCTMKCASSKAKCNLKKGLRIACTAVSSIPIIGTVYTSRKKIKRNWEKVKDFC